MGVYGGNLENVLRVDGFNLFISSANDLRINIRSSTGSAVVDTIKANTDLTTDRYLFAAISINSSNNYTGYLGDSTSATTISGNNPNRAVSTRKIAFGDCHYDSSSFDGNSVIAEAIVFDSAKTAAELDDIYDRSVTRMSSRGITLE
jgi:hypothetical protein